LAFGSGAVTAVHQWLLGADQRAVFGAGADNGVESLPLAWAKNGAATAATANVRTKLNVIFLKLIEPLLPFTG
jgi:hypothetical protein